MAAVWTKTKRELCATCIEALGLDVTFSAAQKWCRNRYNQNISEPQFYTVRRSLQDAVDAAEARQPKPTAVSPTAEVLARIPSATAAPSKDSIADLVKATKALVDKLGKEEAKNLIDAL
jgi:hypothetical protein